MPSLPPTTGSGSASILGTKRKLDPLSEGDSVNAGPVTGSVGDYFNPDAPSIGNTVRTNASSSSLNNGPTAAAPVPLTKRRASQPSIKTVAGEGEVVGLLPTPSTTVSAVNSGASGSATSSERRSSNDSSEAVANGATGATQGNAHVPSYAGSNYTTSSLPMSNVVVPEEGTRYANITPRQIAPLPHETQLEVDTKPGYAFPPPQQRQMLDERMSSAPEMHGQATSLPPSSSSYYETQPSYSNQHPASAAYGPASIQTRIPAQGPLPPDLRSRASTIFGGPPARPMYAANGTPLNASGMAGGKMSPIDHLKLPPAPGGNPPMYSGSMAGVKDGGIPSRPGLAPQSSSQSQVTSTLPYARSPALKVSHKIAERKRRKEMKELFDELRDSIPSMSPNSTTTTIVNGVAVTVPNNNPPPPADVGGRGIKSSKWEVLAKAVEYIAKLQYENAELSNSVIELQRLNQAFQDELSLIKGGGAAPAGGATAPSSFENTGDGMQAGSVAGSIGFSSDPQLYPHHQPHPLYPGGSASVNPSPSPVSVHSMPPLTHHPNSMPAAIGHHHSGSSQSPMPMHQSPLGPNQQQPHPPNATPGLHPISAPPHMASHSFFSPGPGGLSGGVNNDNTASQFSHPNQRHFAIHSQTHSRNVSLGSNSGLSAQNQGHFEHAGSAPPALQQHPHHQQSSLGQSNMQMYPSHHHQTSGSFSGGTGDLGNGQYGQQVPRPGSIRSFNSNQSILSAHSQHSHHPSHSPASVHAGIQSVQQQQDGNATWGSSSPFQQQIQPPGSRNGTVPPGSAQATPMMSPSNASY